MPLQVKIPINFKRILRVVSILQMLLGGMMLTCLPFSFYYDSGDAMPLILSALICISIGVVLWFLSIAANKSLNKREGYLIVTLGWVLMATFGMLPYLLSGQVSSVSDAFFEAMSGFSTTGFTIFNDVEAIPAGILYWRSLTQWIGGMGIIVLTVAIFPFLGFGGSDLFAAEIPGGVSAERIHPRIQETAKRFWYFYVGLTALLAVILKLGGMTFFDAINHALTTLATGGFSTKNTSIMAYDTPLIQYALIVFMFVGGTNYSILYLTFKRKFWKVWKNDEFRTYLLLVLVLSVFIFVSVFSIQNQGSERITLEKLFRDGLFQAVSIITTTGFMSADYGAWSPALTMLFFILIFIGACAGSTSGGIKIIHILVFLKNSYLEFKRILHPRAVAPLKLNGKVVRGKLVTNIIIFISLYMFTFIIGSLLMSALGYDFMTSIDATASALGNLGLGIGKAGPVDNFAQISDATKWLLSFLMLLGRLELFPVLVLFSPFFWRLS